MADFKVVRVEAGEGKPVKDFIYGYRYPVVVTLEDGRKIKASETARLLRDAKAKIAALPEENPVGVKIGLDADGRVTFLSRSFTTGFVGGRLALVPDEF